MIHYPFKRKIISRLNVGYFEGATNANSYSTQYYWRMAHKMAFFDVVSREQYDGAIVMEYDFLILQPSVLWSFMKQVTKAPSEGIPGVDVVGAGSEASVFDVAADGGMTFDPKQREKEH